MRLLAKLEDDSRGDSLEDFEWIDRLMSEWDERVRKSIDSLEKCISPRVALLMSARLTRRQISKITGADESEVERMERAARDHVARTLVEDDHRRSLAGSELTSHIDAVADRMTRATSEEPSRAPVDESWLIRFTKQLSAGIEQIASGRRLRELGLLVHHAFRSAIPLRTGAAAIAILGAVVVIFFSTSLVDDLEEVELAEGAVESAVEVASAGDAVASAGGAVAFRAEQSVLSPAPSSRNGGETGGSAQAEIDHARPARLVAEALRNVDRAANGISSARAPASFALGFRFVRSVVEGSVVESVESTAGAGAPSDEVREPRDLLSEARNLLSKATGLLSESSAEWWQFDGGAGQVVRITAVSDSFDTVVGLFSPDSRELTMDDDGDLGLGSNSPLEAVLPTAGRYLVRVSADDSETGPYEVAVRAAPVGALDIDTAVSGELGDAGAFWTFDGSPGQVVRITAVSDSFDTVIGLFSPDGRELAMDDDGGPGSNSSLETVLPTAGRYLVQVAADDNETGPYEVAVRAVSVGALDIDTAVSGELGDAGDAFWTFDGSVGQVVRITAVSDSFSTAVRLLSPDGRELTWDNNDGGPGTNSYRAVVLRTAGRYLVRVSAYGGSETGLYEVAVRAAPVGALDIDTAVSGELGDAGDAFWTFDGSAGQVVRITAASDSFDTVVGLLSPDGRELARDDDGGPGSNSSLEAVLPAAGRYLVRVSAYDSETGPYEVAVRAAPVGALDIDTAVSGELVDAGDAFWTFDGSAGQLVRITAASDSFDTVVGLLSPDGRELARDDDGGPGSNSSLEAVLPAAGRYLVRVSAYDSETGPYEVAVRAAPVGALDIDTAVSGELVDAGDAFWTFDGSAGQLVRITAASDSFDTVVGLLSPDGRELARGDDGGPGSNSSLEAVLPATGRYLVRVSAYDNTGSYEVAVGAASEALDIDTAVSGELGNAGDAFWTFDGSAGQVVRITAVSDSFDTVVGLLSSDGRELAGDDDGGPGSNSSLEAVLPSAGRYLVRVSAYGNDTGPYEITVGTMVVSQLAQI